MRKLIILLIIGGGALLAGCSKVDYNTVSSPTYLRVFNSLNYNITLANKDQPPPFITMVIDPVFDGSNTVTGGAIVGDFLDQRLSYNPPTPNNAGSTGTLNNEYPGNEKVLTAPVTNGFDLSSWAAIPSGKHRFLFYSRPRNQTPFFQLPASSRHVVLIDSTVTLAETKIYTMEVLQPDAYKNGVTLYLRQEQFLQQSFADSLIYVNFYNLSSVNYLAFSAAAAVDAPDNYTVGGNGIKDTMRAYYNLFTPDSISGPAGNNRIPGYNGVYLTTMMRSLTPAVAPYYSIPLFAGLDSTGGILRKEWEQFQFLSPGYQLPENPLSTGEVTYPRGNYAKLECTDSYYWNLSVNGFHTNAPNLMITTASGNYSRRSFATVNTIEWINNRVYVMTIQRVYAPPVKR